MKAQLDMDRIAKNLGGERRGSVEAKGGYFGALQVAADVEERFRVPARGGRATNPNWTERRLLPLAPGTLKGLEGLAKKMRDDRGVSIDPMQLAAILLEKAFERLTAEEANNLVREPSAREGTARRRGES